jgi:hypothetical protein
MAHITKIYWGKNQCFSRILFDGCYLLSLSDNKCHFLWGGMEGFSTMKTNDKGELLVTIFRNMPSSVVQRLSAT